MLHAQLGRFVSRDPISSSRETYLCCGANPLVWHDPMGQWRSGTHAALTSDSFLGAFPCYNEMPGVECSGYILKVVTQSNIDQDRGSYPGAAPYDPGQQNALHYCRDKNQSVSQATAIYLTYLTVEGVHFHISLAAGMCEDALKSLGRLTHSWQDHYGHAVKLDGDANAWGIGIATGDPDAPGTDVKPPTFWFFGRPIFGEHGRTEPGDRDVNSALRRREATAFVASRFQPMLEKWLAKCRCHCPPEGGYFVF